MDFHDFPRILGKSGCESHPPPQVVCTPILRQAASLRVEVIYCIGEQLEDREAGKTNDVIAQHMATVRRKSA